METLKTAIVVALAVVSSSIILPKGCVEAYGEEYFPPYVLKNGDTVEKETVFGFHRQDAEKFRVALLDLQSCKESLEKCVQIPKEEKPAIVHWALPAGIGFVGGVGVSLLIFYLAR